MLKIIVGEKGMGKTKTMIESVNSSVNTAKGSIVFISNNIKRHMYDIKHSIRMVDTSEFELGHYAELYGFICGIISSDFDISNIFIDSVTKIVGNDLSSLETFFNGIEKLAEKFNISFLFTISMNESLLSEGLRKYL